MSPFSVSIARSIGCASNMGKSGARLRAKSSNSGTMASGLPFTRTTSVCNEVRPLE